MLELSKIRSGNRSHEGNLDGATGGSEAIATALGLAISVVSAVRDGYAMDSEGVLRERARQAWCFGSGPCASQ